LGEHPGGSTNFAADRDEAARLLAADPRLPELARQNRAFLARAVTHVARQGVAQFIDVGAGLPTSPSTHEAAGAVLPGARVAYVDHDRCKSGCAHVRWAGQTT
jgi:hypothetical protein